MLISSYGLFWRADEIDWHPGQGNKGKFRLLGRIGANTGTIKVADFRYQKGIYLLYGNHGAHYVGLTREQTLGKRVQDHLHDEHEGKWDRFCWFGFRAVLKGTRKDGFQRLKKLTDGNLSKTHMVIGEIEALLIRVMDLRNTAQMSFSDAEEWIQIKKDEVDRYVSRL